ncbi:SGNH/GDSL hydrolase family protein [Aeromicrobium sp. P5_D10]
MRPGLFATSLGVVLLAGCSSSATPLPEPTPIAGLTSYVAMGDSFVGGPGIDPYDRESGACHRSERNYPTLLAARLGISGFADVSCATTGSAEIGGTAEVAGETFAAQLDAVDADTRLITIGTGGNDGLLYESLFDACYFPETRSPQACTTFVERDADKVLAATKEELTGWMRVVQFKAPDARIVLVGYLRYLPDAGPCRAFDLTAAQVQQVLTVQNRLEATQQAAAKALGIEFVSLQNLSRGHDACAGQDAWVHALEGADGDGTPMHPTAAGMTAVADELNTRLRAPVSPTG